MKQFSRNHNAFAHIIRSKKASILPILAASLIPLLVLIGSSFDFARGQLAQNRLQHACDSAILAVRKSSSGSNGLDARTKKIGQDFFKANFNEGYVQARNPRIYLTHTPGETAINGEAKANVPTSIMQMFGKEYMKISAKCTSDLNLGNIDIAMVLDYSQSMTNNTPDGKTRLDSLKIAAKNFYNTLNGYTKTSGARVRYSFVPFSGNVNAGKLVHDLNPQYIIGGKKNEHWFYASRKPVNKNGGAAHNPKQFHHWLYATYNDKIPVSGYVETISDSYSGNGVPRPTDNQYWTGRTKAAVRDKWPGCMEEPNTDNRARTFRFDNVKGIVSPQAKSPLYDMDIDHVPQPNDNATRFRPQWQEISFFYNTRTGQNTQYYHPPTYAQHWNVSGYKLHVHGDKKNDLENNDNRYKFVYQIISCPTPATKLHEMSKSDYFNYLDKAHLNWGTHHGIGLLWGGRMMSPQGIFAKTVNEKPKNGLPVSRHLIFMSDGLSFEPQIFPSPWGIMLRAQRNYNYPGGIKPADTITKNTKAIKDMHFSRIAAICESIKSKGIRLWTISFGVPLTESMEQCASPDSAFEANRADELDSVFQSIADQAGGLRLTN